MFTLTEPVVLLLSYSPSSVARNLYKYQSLPLRSCCCECPLMMDTKMQLHPQYRWAGQPNTERAFESNTSPGGSPRQCLGLQYRSKTNPGGRRTSQIQSLLHTSCKPLPVPSVPSTWVRLPGYGVFEETSFAWRRGSSLWKCPSTTL